MRWPETLTYYLAMTDPEQREFPRWKESPPHVQVALVEVLLFGRSRLMEEMSDEQRREAHEALVGWGYSAAYRRS